MIAGVAVDYIDGRKHGGELFAFIVITFDYFRRKAVVTQPLGKIIAYSAAAADDDVFDFFRHYAESGKKNGKLVYGSRDENAVAFAKDEVAVRSNRLAVAQNNADKHLTADDISHFFQRDTAKGTVLPDFQLDYLNSALCEGIAVEKARIFEQSFYFKRSLPFRIYSHRKPENIAHAVYLVAVFGVSDSRYRVYFGVHFMGDGARKKVHLVLARRGDEKVGVLRACGGKHAMNCAVSADSHNVIMLHSV